MKAEQTQTKNFSPSVEISSASKNKLLLPSIVVLLTIFIVTIIVVFINTKTNLHESFTPVSSLNKDCKLIADYFKKLNTQKEIQRKSISVSPNATLLTGNVGCVKEVQSKQLKIKPEMSIFLLEVKIVGAQNMENFANRLAGKEGQTIILFSKKQISSDIKNQNIDVQVSYKGDERGGGYWVISPISSSSLTTSKK